MKTEDKGYTEHLSAQGRGWKRVLDVQLSYRLHLQSLHLGFVLDVGCGVGRNLVNLGGQAAGVGVDHNPHSVAIARARGLVAYTPEEFEASACARGEVFDSLLVSHVLEHLPRREAVALVRHYLPWLKVGGRVVLITPQELGFGSDATHVEFTDFKALAQIAEEAGLSVQKAYSFPFPRVFGRVFKYNEFITIARNG
jgi:2-polyprenyl-3-methyl-5-hydroxy-6-metoxy-1,4-benzoquinol methylase